MNPTELFELIQKGESGGFIYADEMPVARTSIESVNVEYYKRIFKMKFGISFDTTQMDLTTSLRNQQLFADENLTLAGLLLFCDNRHTFKPLYSVQCIAVEAVNLLGSYFDDSEPVFQGKLEDVYYQTLNFISRHIKKRPSGDSFNSQLKWQIPKEVFEELVVNALVHRDYFINSTIKVFIFLDRIEIISPGKLPNSQNEQTIRNGISIPRNPVLQSFAQYVLPYKGAGTGIMRALFIYPDIEFRNEPENERFVAIIKRK